MADLLHGWVPVPLQTKVNQGMPSIFHQKDRAFQGRVQGNGDAMSIWGTDQHYRISGYLTKDSILNNLEDHIKEKVAGICNEAKTVAAMSQGHYMDLDKLKDRMPTWPVSHENHGDIQDAAGLLFSSRMGSTAWSSEVQQNMEVSASNSSHSSSTANCAYPAPASRSIASSFRNSNQSSGLVIDNGLSAPHGYIYNEPHQIVSNLPVGSGGNFMHSPADFPRPGQCTGGTFSPDIAVMSPNKYTECRNGHFLHNLGGGGKDIVSEDRSLYKLSNKFPNSKLDFAASYVRTIDEAATPEVPHLFGNSQFISDSKLSATGKLEIPSTSFGFEGNCYFVNQASTKSCLNLSHAPMYCQSNLQCAQQAPQMYENLPQLLQMEKNEPGSKLGHLPQSSRLKQESWPFTQGLHEPTKEHFTELTHLGKDQSIDLLQAQREKVILGGAIERKNYRSLDQKACKNQMKASAVFQCQPFLKESTRDKFSMFDGSAHISVDSRSLILFEHARICLVNEGKCGYPQCGKMKEILTHLSKCSDDHCAKQCDNFRRLFEHYRSCCNSACCICCPVKVKLKEPALVNHTAGFTTLCHDTLAYEQSPLKRMRTENFSSHCSWHEVQHGQFPLKPVTENSYSSQQHEISHFMPAVVPDIELSPRGLHNVTHKFRTSLDPRTEVTKPESKPFATSSWESLDKCHQTDAREPVMAVKSQLDILPAITGGIGKQCQQAEVESDRVELDVKHESSALSSDPLTERKIGKREVKGTSLVDTFTRQQIKEHITSLRRCFGQREANVCRNQVSEGQVDDDPCSLCGMDKLLFEPLPRYCASCSGQINPRGTYYTIERVKDATNGPHACQFFCSKCYNTTSSYLKVAGEEILKANLERKLNYANDAGAEMWVPCEKCGLRQHQICALYNNIRNLEGQAAYTCPSCILPGIESGEHQPLARTMIPGAEELPTTKLSDHIEEWLFRRLNKERQERAKKLGKSDHEVAGAEGLFVRVVSSVDKILKVKQSFRGIFEGEHYPEEFPYTAKAILLFQKMEGADVCLFGMYVQEYGAECAFPNQRHVCLSYIDSVKHFRPDVKAITGEALRTFVYHEILIGYLDYCKKRGFISCYIWACPPVKGDNYILYCHPDTQKMPKPDKLRDWYRAIIKKAVKESIVVDHSNLYDQFFVKRKESKANVTAARLPYFESDHWPGEAEKLLRKDGSIPEKKGAKAATERAIRAAKRDASIQNQKDTLLMHQLGEFLRPTKEDFLMVHLCYFCKHCCRPITNGTLWACKVCKSFRLCENCYDTEKNLEEKDRHRGHGKEKHPFYMVETENLPADTDDKDDTIHSKIFDTRMKFLSICQENHYQFDTLRRAKHSTMMVLYHLHNPCAPAFKTSCTLCFDDIEAAQGWHCMICSDYDICDSCHEKEGGVQHDHELVRYFSKTNHDILQNKYSERNQALKTLLDLVVHASKCFGYGCGSRDCRKIKELFHHGKHCQTRCRGGCGPCKRMWIILKMHARTCKDSDCCVPRCMDIKEFINKTDSVNPSFSTVINEVHCFSPSLERRIY